MQCPTFSCDKDDSSEAKMLESLPKLEAVCSKQVTAAAEKTEVLAKKGGGDDDDRIIFPGLDDTADDVFDDGDIFMRQVETTDSIGQERSKTMYDKCIPIRASQTEKK